MRFIEGADKIILRSCEQSQVGYKKYYEASLTFSEVKVAPNGRILVLHIICFNLLYLMQSNISSMVLIIDYYYHRVMFKPARS